ncbi:MAG: hypothetical protein WCJ67_08505 [Thermoleophilia bacterium]
MHRTLTIALGTAVALVTAAVAVATIPAVVGVSEATATFSTTAIANPKVRTCTADTKTWETTDGRYTGTVTSTNAVLGGALVIHAHTTYNKTDGLGFADGEFRINDGDSRVRGTFSGTIKNGQLVGYLTGRSHGNHATVFGNLSAAFAGGTSNFVDGKLGAGGSTAVLAVVAGQPCKPAKKSEPKPEHAKSVEVEGTITALTAGPPATITVTGKRGPAVTCTVGAYAIPAGFPLTTKVEMECKDIGTPAVLTLVKLKREN